MESSEDKIKRSVRYKILIENKSAYFNVGTMIINTYGGDVFYSPSNKAINNPNVQNAQIKEIDHVSWHKDGQVHIKYKGISREKYDIIQKNGERQKISEIGFQELIQDTIKDYQKLPRYAKKVVDLDVVFKVGNYLGSVAFYFSMVSGKLIAAQYRGEKVPIQNFNIKKLDGFNVVLRALGWHSGNSDVGLQYSLRRATAGNLRSYRHIFIPHDMKISKLNEAV